MKTIKHIPHPDLSNVRRLSPLELNNIHMDEKRTVLTEEVLARLAAGGQQNSSKSKNE